MGYFLKNPKISGARCAMHRRTKAHLAATLYRLKNPTAKGWKRYCRDSGSVYWNAPSQRRKQRTTKNERPSVLLLPAELDVDYNRDGKIEPSTVSGSADAGKVTTDNPWRFWINDSDENGDIGGNDVPGSGNNNAFQVVRGMRDLLNFFPAYLDIKGLLQVLPAESNTYKIKQADGAIDFVLTDLTPDKAGQFLKQSPMQLNPSGNLDNPIILSNGSKVHVTSDGATLPTDWLNKIKNQNEGVILVDGYAKTTQPLVLEVTNNSTGQVMTQLKLPLSIDSIEKMYRVRNLRNDDFVGTPADQGAPDNTGEPSNYPDKLTDGKNVIFVHGYNVSGDQARGWSAEMFKRFFWSGSKAKFHSITWFGDPYTTGSANPQYHDAVINSFAASADVATYVNGLSGQKTIIAHSLGNMVVSSAIKDHGMTVGQYFLVDAAVAEEAYDGSVAVDYQGLAHPDWIDGSYNPTYSTTLWASEWHSLFSSGDGRQALTWRDRFAGVTGYNFYSSTEDVLGRDTDSITYSVVNTALINTGQYAWTLQEKLKGRRVTIPLLAAAGSLYGGWQFNLTDPANPNDPIYYQVRNDNEGSISYRAPLPPSSLGFITNALLQRLPFFDPGFGEDPNAVTPRTGNTANTVGPSWIRDLYGSSGSATASTYTKKTTLLAQAFPALTQPTGANSQDIFSNAGVDQRNFNMPSSFVLQNAWPSTRGSSNGTSVWHHSDVKDIGYPYLYSIFDKFVQIGGLQ